MLDLEINIKDPKNFVIQIWKILEFESITLSQIIEKICFIIKLPFSPKKVRNVIKFAIKEGLLEIQQKNKISLSDELRKEIEYEEIKAKKDFLKRFGLYINNNRIEDNTDHWNYLHEIKEKISGVTSKSLSKKEFKLDDKTSQQYNELLKGLFNEEDLNAGKKLNKNRFKFTKVDEENEYLEMNVKGSHNENYILIIDGKKMVIKHDCYIFKNKRAPNKQLCKHIFRALFFLKRENVNLGFTLIKKLKNKENWKFLF
ncbi:MAG: hypothetical protein ACTSO2_01970 [Promethearchaeota archaeon]